MDISADVEQIIAQAPDWTFAGDCALLALMKRISQNLEERGERTSRNLRDFETSVKQVDITLNNATNSLRSLQFGNQFVEYRVEEVDDADLAMPEEKKKKPELPPKSSEEMAKEFLENNLRMFRKNYEPVTIEVPDSDDEDGPVNSTTVFRAKNPYDAIPLPYIIGTKEWQEHKYAGLYDSKENSEDDRSEEFSSSSSDEKETESKTITMPSNKLEEHHVSDSSSLASFAREPAIVSPVIKPAVQIAEPAIRTQPRPIISSQRNPHERNMFAALRQSPPSDDPPSTSSSPTSSPAFRNQSSRLPIASTASLSSSSSSPAQQPPRLFDEAVSTQAPKETEIKPSQTKRMPVNLFNDDEFKSFMSEIVDKVQSKTPSSSVSPATTISTQEPPKTVKPTEKYSKPVAPKQIVEQSVPKRVNLFDDSPPLSPTPRSGPVLNNNKATGAIPKQSSVQSPDEDLFGSAPAMPKENPFKKQTKPVTKSLFDDDLEDDDFLSSFTPKAKPPEQKLLSKPKPSLFDDDDLDIDDIFTKPSAQPKMLSEKLAGKTSLFKDDDQDDVTDLFGSKKTKEIQKETFSAVSPDKKVQTPVASKKSLFDDIEDEDLFGTPKAKNLIRSEQHNDLETIEGSGATIEKDKKQNEIVAENFKNIETKEKQLPLKSENQSVPILRDSPPPMEVTEQMADGKELSPVKGDTTALNIHTTKDLFSEDVTEDESFPSPSNNTAKPKGASEAREFNKPIEQNTSQTRKNVSPVIPPTTISTKPTDLFNEDFSDDDTFLSASISKNKPVANTATDEIKKPSGDQLVNEIKPEELPQQLPENKIDNDTRAVNEKDELVPEMLGKSQIDEAVSESPPPDDYQSNEDPIISMVADVTNKTSVDTLTPKKPADLAAAQQIMQNYSNLFSDEPPDDSEFFQTLGSSGLSSLSASKIFDSEHDFFEPALPNIPSATKPSPVTPGDQPSLSSDYGAMCLFSDVPPEDNDHDGEEVQNQAEAEKDEFASTTRIHTIFYDDFSETARAGAVQQASKQFTFDDEPPPADEPDRSKVKESPELRNPTSPVKKLKMPNININVHALLPGSGGAPKLLRKPESSSSEREESQATSQLDVSAPQAEVSGQTAVPSSDGALQHVNKSRARGPAKRRPSTRRGRKENYAKSLLDAGQDEGHPTASPSIQRASSRDNPEVEHFEPSPIEAPLFQHVKLEKLISTTAQQIQPQLQRPSSSNAFGSFLDSPDEDDSFFNSVPTKTVEGKQGSDPPKSYRSFLDSPDKDDHLFSDFETQTVSNEPTVDRRKLEKTFAPPKMAKSFLDSPDEDDDFLFNSVKTKADPKAQKSPAPAAEIVNASQTVTTAPPKPSNAKLAAKEQIKPKSQAAPKLFDDSDDDDDLFANAAASAPSIQPASKPAQTKQQPKPAATSLFSSDDDEPEVPAKTAPVKKLPVKASKSLFSDDEDDDDLFGGSSTSKESATKKTKPVARTATKPPASKTTTSTATIPANSGDNPLADLLDFK
ncbi:WASH complex subunit 2 [Drosophila santomea]|uniref:WASH complex subunit 2 n=1 Tax=Drosophila santomea TaxID=129105 RepID=UPI00195463F9|nr:WASH complex subunit 2 [Drosophila santomea]